MSETINNDAPDSGMSFCDKVVFYIFITPFVAAAIGYIGLYVMPSALSEQVLLFGVFSIELLNFISAFAVCCMIKSHRQRSTIWIALASLLASGVLGGYAFLAFALFHYFPNGFVQ